MKEAPSDGFLATRTGKIYHSDLEQVYDRVYHVENRITIRPYYIVCDTFKSQMGPYVKHVMLKHLKLNNNIWY